MKLPKILSILTLSLLTPAAVFADDTPVTPSPLLIKNITVIDGTGQDPYNASILIQENKISQIIRGALVPAGQATIIDGRGKFLMPGLIDLQAHITLQSNVPGNLKDYDSGELSDLYRGSQEKDAQKRLLSYKTILRLSLKSGVTTFIDSVDSIADVTMVRSAINGQDYPNFYSSGPILSYKGSHPYVTDSTVDAKDPNAGWKYWLPEINGHTSPADLDAAQSILKTDLTKIIRDGGLAALEVVVDGPTENGKSSPRVPFATLKTICDVAHSFQKPVFFSANSDEGIQDAARAGAKIKVGAPVIKDPKGLVTSVSEQSLQSLSQNQVSVLTLVSSSGGMENTYLKNQPAFQTESFKNPTLAKDTIENYKKLLTQYKDQKDADPERALFVKTIDAQAFAQKAIQASLLQARGSAYHLSVIPAGDEGAAWTFHGNFPNELNFISGRGGQSLEAILTPQELIKAATLDAATLMNLQDFVGSIEVGKQADLLILSHNPLDDISNIKKIDQVIKNGTIVNFLKSPN